MTKNRKVGDWPVSDDYEIGYGKPPKATQFKPGQSGNPKGRPRKPRNTSLRQALEERLSDTITVQIEGRWQTMATADVIAFQLTRRAAKGDAKALAAIAKHVPEKSIQETMQDHLRGTAQELQEKLWRIVERRTEEKTHQAAAQELDEENS